MVFRHKTLHLTAELTGKEKYKQKFAAAGKLVEIVSIQLKHGVKDEDSEVKVRIIPKDGTVSWIIVTDIESR